MEEQIRKEFEQLRELVKKRKHELVEELMKKAEQAMT